MEFNFNFIDYIIYIVIYERMKIFIWLFLYWFYLFMTTLSIIVQVKCEYKFDMQLFLLKFEWKMKWSFIFDQLSFLLCCIDSFFFNLIYLYWERVAKILILLPKRCYEFSALKMLLSTHKLRMKIQFLFHSIGLV